MDSFGVAPGGRTLHTSMRENHRVEPNYALWNMNYALSRHRDWRSGYELIIG